MTYQLFTAKKIAKINQNTNFQYKKKYRNNSNFSVYSLAFFLWLWVQFYIKSKIYEIVLYGV